MHPLDPVFRPYEPYLAEIISRYPASSSVACAGRAPGTVRQNLSRALRAFVQNPGIESSISRETAALVEREFVFSPNLDGSLYIGPKRKRVSSLPVFVATEAASSPSAVSIPPIDCSNPTTLHAVLHLKNFDHLTLPLTLTNIQPSSDLASLYPNIELLLNTNGSYTIL